MSEQKKPDKGTLTEDDIVSERDVGRRRMVSLLGAGAIGAVALATGCGRRRVVHVTTVSTGITDNDGGACADPAGGGRGVTGVTDRDGGACADPVNRGRGGGAVVVQQQPSTGITDRDAGGCADPAGGGRGYSGLTDSDGGYCSDPGGRGRTGY